MPRSCLIGDRAQDIGAFRAGLAPLGLGAVMPAQAQFPNPQLRGLERYPARPGTRRRAQARATRSPRYAPYAQRSQDFPHRADVGLWLKSKINAARTRCIRMARHVHTSASARHR